MAGETLCEPLTALAPLQPPEAEQLVALLELHVSVAKEPEVIEVGLAERERAGAGVGGVIGVPLNPS